MCIYIHIHIHTYIYIYIHIYTYIHMYVCILYIYVYNNYNNLLTELDTSFVTCLISKRRSYLGQTRKSNIKRIPSSVQLSTWKD